MGCPWFVFVGVVIWVASAFLVLCCCKLAGEADDRIERMGVREDEETP